MKLTITTEQLDSWSLVRVAGELDMATAGALREHLTDRLNDGVHDVAVDLAELSFIDSSGLGALVSSLKLAVTKGGSLVLLSPGPQAMRVFDASGLLSILPIYSSLEELPAARGGQRG